MSVIEQVMDDMPVVNLQQPPIRKRSTDFLSSNARGSSMVEDFTMAELPVPQPVYRSRGSGERKKSSSTGYSRTSSAFSSFKIRRNDRSDTKNSADIGLYQALADFEKEEKRKARAERRRLRNERLSEISGINSIKRRASIIGENVRIRAKTLRRKLRRLTARLMGRQVQGEASADEMNAQLDMF
mmetsp:Transcript_6238/g.7171  ORF Transcript_6238/g.7171 Transcript_6238/m.7171 type:complete len:185 (+) Transcript_6238:215-769(+)|eukprot:CAMPEP_0184017638 /NCGR_PEP_ID=MMETSP0954-20121128/7660_1 /TAXON_ID=627963 /ORGANISM="Aplanochytrium sp, Strain PBS07" /LENGTH=184 /DNA_ID=CAMNT_0026298921 /DNA_START=203 /DNA_END=757 /DNA_ORIENTATION=+